MLNPTAFKYLTPKLRLDEASLSEAQVMANAFHFVCSSQRCISLVEGILSRRQHLAGPGVPEPVRPRFVWEPVPDLCMPEELDMFRRAVRLVDVVSPNTEEFAAFFASDAPPRSQRELAAQVLGWRIGIDGEGALVVREGSHGCTAYSRSWDCHLPAFYDQAQSSAILDPTGGGNAFLGALAMALGGKVQPPFSDLESQLMLSVSEATIGCVEMIYALVYATIAASYAIQQSGMPLLTGNTASGETWNGESFGSRVSTYIKRENDHIIANVRKDEA